MKFMRWMKDGGPQSTVHGLFVIEIKSLFSVVLLKFSDGSRDAYHNHAFNAWSWVLSGYLEECHLNGLIEFHEPSWRRIFTGRRTFHRVVSLGTTWAISFRGPWDKKWNEYIPKTKELITLVHGRKLV